MDTLLRVGPFIIARRYIQGGVVANEIVDRLHPSLFCFCSLGQEADELHAKHKAKRAIGDT